MESYPNEFTAQHRPLLFVAGLNSPQLSQDQLDPFDGLLQALRTTLASPAARSHSLWDNTRGVNNDFHVALVEKTVRFPPLKARPSSEQPAAPLHSPISPLSPSSPLYPDGIIAPIWIRKHREMVPAVFLLALRLFEFIPPAETVAGPLDGNLAALREEQERKHDAELVKEIIERRRTTVERGIKLAVVLLCSRPLLDSSSLDARLSQIRRQSTLDSRASLFVISPVEIAEVENFVESLRRELWDAALDYYREHGRRVRRKRARSLSGKGGLGEKGWTVRYDYKMGFMAEMRGEIEVSLKHYEDCYETLLEMFPQPTLLTPRTKRWAEAKVLADCLTVKISKFYLYLNESSRSVAQLNRHITLFRSLSETWGIGEQTFEFWSWLSKQYRLYAELVSLAVRSGFRIPLLRPPPQPRSVPSGMQQPNLAGLVPENVLQHAGYYFYLSATCTVERRNRYRAVEGVEGAPVSSAIAHESKVNHSDIIIDLYTKAYEYFKLHHSSRMSLFMASQIALAHYEAGNHATAVKFHDRIASTYRREGWTSILQPIVRMMSNSTMELKDYESAVRSLLELIAPGSEISLQERESCCAQLLEVLRTKPCPTTSPITIDASDSATTQLFDTRLVFAREQCEVNDSVPFQFSIAAPSRSRTASLVFERMTIRFNGDVAPIVVTNHGTESATELELYEVAGGRETRANLCWMNGATKVFTGTLLSTTEVDLSISFITLELKEGDWILELRLRSYPDPTGTPRWYNQKVDQMLCSILARRDASICVVQPRSLRVDIQVNHASPSYLDEEYPIHLEILNRDEVPVTIQLDALLQPVEGESRNRIMVNDESSASLIKGVHLGVLAPGATLRTATRLVSVGIPGPRQVDLSIHVESHSVSNIVATSLSSTGSSAVNASAIETIRTVNIEAIQPFFSAFELDSFHRRRAIQPLMDLSKPSDWESSNDVALIAKLAARGPWDVEIFAIDLVVSELERKVLRVVDSSLDGQESSFPLQWSYGDAYNIVYRLDVAPTSSSSPSTSTSTGVLNISWRRIGELAISTTQIPLPTLDPTRLTPSIFLRIPTFLTLHTPANLSYRFSNPTSRLLNLSTSIEGAENFVFAGPRKFPRFVLAPEEERVLTLVVIPLAAGSSSLPKLRVFVDRAGEVIRTERVGDSEASEQAVEEVAVHVETDSISQSSSDRVSPGEVGAGDPLVVLVLPR